MESVPPEFLLEFSSLLWSVFHSYRCITAGIPRSRGEMHFRLFARVGGFLVPSSHLNALPIYWQVTMSYARSALHVPGPV